MFQILSSGSVYYPTYHILSQDNRAEVTSCKHTLERPTHALLRRYRGGVPYQSLGVSLKRAFRTAELGKSYRLEQPLGIDLYNHFWPGKICLLFEASHPHKDSSSNLTSADYDRRER
jgi:hypothetical protein